jgi:uncharacterized protein YlxW (UPF0749 family)
MAPKVKLQLVVLVVSLVVGLMMSLLYRSVHDTYNAYVPMSQDEVAHLKIQIKSLQGQNTELSSQLVSLNQQIQSYETTFGDHSGIRDEMQKELDDARILTGALPVKGPGVEIILDNGSGSVTGVGEYGVVKGIDVMRLVNELFTAGAEAVAVNGQRIVRIDARGLGTRFPGQARLAAPFDIKAIGDPHTLATALSYRGGIIDWLRAQSLQVTDPKPVVMMHLPAYNGARITFDSRVD